MSFLKKHYEKIVLTGFLIIFVICLLWQIKIITASLDVTDSDLNIPKRSSDYRNIDFAEFNALEEITKDAFWLDEAARNKQTRDGEFTTLTSCFRASRCPHCNQIISLNEFNIDHKCSFCEAKLRTPKNYLDVNTDLDTDGDGIPDKAELDNKLDANNPNDAYDDSDGDGFPNIYEYSRSRTSITDPKSHPPLISRLVLREIKRVKLPFKFKKVDRTRENKKDWTIQVSVRSGRKKREKSEFCMLKQGENIIKVDKRTRFKIVDIDTKFEKVYNKSLKTTEEVDRSDFIIQKVDSKGEAAGEPFKAQIGKTIYEPLQIISFKDLRTGKRLKNLQKGERITLGDDKIGKEKYIIFEVLPEKRSVKLRKFQVIKEGKKKKIKIEDKDISIGRKPHITIEETHKAEQEQRELPPPDIIDPRLLKRRK